VSLGRPLHRHALPTQTWAAAVDRYRRAVDRYYADLEVMPARALRQKLTELGGPLDAVLEDFEDVLAHRAALDKGRSLDVLACIHRAATLCAHATETALMAHDASWRHDDDDVSRRLERVRELVRAIDELGGHVRPVW
jgi:hypothetical protein